MSVDENLIRNLFETNAPANAGFTVQGDDTDFKYAAVKEFFKNMAGGRVLDIGCGYGRFSLPLIRDGYAVTGIDFATAMVKEAGQKCGGGGDFLAASACRLPFKEGVFDAVLSVEVFEHIPAVDAAIGEIARVLKPGGRCVIIDKNLLSLTKRFFFPRFIIKRYREMTGKWFYPKNFPFKERWFTRRGFLRALKRYFAFAEGEYLYEKICAPHSRIFKLLPFTNGYIAWKCTKVRN